MTRIVETLRPNDERAIVESSRGDSGGRRFLVGRLVATVGARALRRGRCRRLLFLAGRRRLRRLGRLAPRITVSLPVVLPMLAAAAATLITAWRRRVRVHHPVIVLGVLQVAFSSDAVTGRQGVARERLVFLQHLTSISPNLHVRAIALNDRSVAEMGAPTIGSSTPLTLCVWTLFHANRILDVAK